jgi:hypothetical protein
MFVLTHCMPHQVSPLAHLHFPLSQVLPGLTLLHDVSLQHSWQTPGKDPQIWCKLLLQLLLQIP